MALVLYQSLLCRQMKGYLCGEHMDVAMVRATVKM